MCTAPDAYIDRLSASDEYYVECVNCRVYRATRKAFRHLEYLRAKGEPAGLHRLERLAAALRSRERGAAVRLDYDTWEQLAKDG